MFTSGALPAGFGRAFPKAATPTPVATVDADGLTIPRVDIYQLSIPGPLAVGAAIDRVWVPSAGRIKKMVGHIGSQASSGDYAKVDVTVGAAPLHPTGPELVNMGNPLVSYGMDVMVNGHVLGVDVTEVSGTVNDLRVMIWVEVTK